MADRSLDTTELKPWVEPEIRTLEISETHLTPNRGGDGGLNGTPDCSKS